MTMRRRGSKLFILTVLAIVFTLGLTYATLETPRIFNSILSVYFPDIYWKPESIEALMIFARPLGYACLVLVIILIVVGFKTRRANMSSLATVAFFLPTFGYFALSMFFLAGVGIMRILWMPFWDSSTNLLKLGDIVYLPYMISAYPFSLVGVDVRMPLAYLAAGLGLLTFTLGTVAWFYGRSEGADVVDFWIYRHSRHSQYLDYIIWSYGIMLLAALTQFPRGGYNPGPSLPWLISSLIVICVALTEEIEMAKKHEEKYLKYKSSAPFMLPLPSSVSSIITAPIRIMFKKNLPESEKEVICTFVVYIIIFVLLSLPFLIFNWPPDYGWYSWPFR